jgi:uncharacterized membrane protein
MLRKNLFKHTDTHPTGFTRRGLEVLRIETFSDAVFAFAVTLLIVSLEVPKTYDELLINMRGFIAFGICFGLLMLIWNEQNVFFRRYGLDDKTTILLNCALLFIVMFYVYPLKFLFSVMFSGSIYGEGKSPFSIQIAQVSQLMVIYGLGYVIIYTIFLLLYLHALRHKYVLQLTRLEVFDTLTKVYAQAMLIAIGLVSITLALVLPPGIAGFSGMAYVLIWPVFGVCYSIRARLRKKIPHASSTHHQDIEA